ncbi:MAG TPA: hypothetical protein DCW66_07985 [Sphingobacterium sp.]|uniref:lipopolysaccharide biosynthesis protein n=1 Tax=Sphingobacterium multivorum TaxID=28454 RepID=UPI000E9AC4F1|nr:oligosaccharide flippase family protein [Sphingobacterium multivorum]HAU53108.1 hypothetical protein [Sphingobacterium sp.]
MDKAGGKRLFKETLIYSVGNFGSKILSFLLLPFYTFFLSSKEIGEYDLLISAVSLFVPLSSLQLSDAVYRWLIEKPDILLSDKKRIISTSILGVFFSFFVSLVLFLLYDIYSPIKYKGFFISLVFLNGLFPYFQNLLRGEGKIKQYAVSGILTTFFIVLFNFVFVYFFQWKVYGIFVANIIAYIIAIIIVVIETRFVYYFDIKSFDKSLFKRMCAYSLPLVPNLMSWWLISSASKFIILSYLGADANGVYAVASRFPVILTVINSVLLLPIQDAVLKENNNETFEKLFSKFVVFELAIALLLSVLSPIMTKLLVADKYFDTWRYMPFLFLGVSYNAIGAFIGLAYQKAKNTLKITITTLIGAIISIVISFVTINNIGLQGISVAFLVGFLIVLLIRYLVIFKGRYNKKILVLILLAPIVCCLFVYYFNKILY